MGGRQPQMLHRSQRQRRPIAAFQARRFQQSHFENAHEPFLVVQLSIRLVAKGRTAFPVDLIGLPVGGLASHGGFVGATAAAVAVAVRGGVLVVTHDGRTGAVAVSVVHTDFGGLGSLVEEMVATTVFNSEGLPK